MPFRLRDNLHWCDSGGRIVFLDVRADRYFCLPSAMRSPFLALATGTADAQDLSLLDKLTERGLLVPAASVRPFQQPPSVEPPRSDVLVHPGPRVGIGAMARALAWEHLAAWQLRSRTFSDVVARAVRRGAKDKTRLRNGASACLSIAAAADAIAFMTRSHNRCLVRGLGVHAACRAKGIPAKLVFGVIAHPFAAHCWVQLDEGVLVGGFEHARLYTPIMVVE